MTKLAEKMDQLPEERRKKVEERAIGLIGEELSRSRKKTKASPRHTTGNA